MDMAQAQTSPRLMPCTNIEVFRPTPLPQIGENNGAGLEMAPRLNSAHCIDGVKLEAGDGVTIWRCNRDQEIVEHSAALQWPQSIMIYRNNRFETGFSDEVMAGELDRFELIKVDLDNDGNRENILALWHSQSNGLGVHYWSLRVLDKDWRPIWFAPDVQDWGPSAIVKSPNGDVCQIAITKWVEDKSRRNGGRTLEAKFFKLENGEMRLSTDIAPRSRRLTNRFEAERLATFENPIGNYEGDPAKWLSRDTQITPIR